MLQTREKQIQRSTAIQLIAYLSLCFLTGYDGVFLQSGFPDADFIAFMSFLCAIAVTIAGLFSRIASLILVTLVTFAILSVAVGDVAFVGSFVGIGWLIFAVIMFRMASYLMILQVLYFRERKRIGHSFTGRDTTVAMANIIFGGILLAMFANCTTGWPMTDGY